ncbi:cell division inhibitor SepF [Tamaricihabitans halophyticus]|uniref:Cell division protein SepF n=1 Tax=Tamaricihabitans halophyticus TaxID=1262583 RepID=A0A4R2Q950_9PSEU|nr:cell division protein SepF [Tamaricihabitans halophyticus]TCP45412.1 cell division inhibitor SepF [Tamaricihabitans halophyticus]
MSALQKLKAYFGMVPADEDDYGPEDDYRGDYRDGYRDDDYYYDDEYDDLPERPGRSRRGFDGARSGFRSDDLDDDYEPTPRGGGGRGGSRPMPAVQGALAMDSRPEPVARLRSVPENARQSSSYPMGRITTLHPSSFQEARTIGENYREGTPVIMNLTDLDDADARRLVDFAAGLVFAMRGSMDKVTNKVFLLSPPDIDVTAEDTRRIAEGGLFHRG